MNLCIQRYLLCCQKRGSNPYSSEPRDFKSLVSTNSTILARSEDRYLLSSSARSITGALLFWGMTLRMNGRAPR